MAAYPQTGDIHYVFFDTETTGLPLNYKAPSSDVRNWPRLVQLSWIAEDKSGNVINKGNYIIRPDGFKIPEESSAVHGITTEIALENGVDLQQALDEFLADAEQASVLVGHNVGFDIKVAGCECVRTKGFDPIEDMYCIDTMAKTTNFCKIPGRYGYKWPKLQELYVRLFGEEFEDAHDSSADIAATEKCFWELKRRRII